MQFHAKLAEVTQPLTACSETGAKLEQTEQTLRAFEKVK
jgi:hypothetical protein